MTITTNRRKFLTGATTLAGILTVGAPVAANAAPGKIRKFANGTPMEGVFAIGWTVCTPDDKLDLAAMASQQKFLNRGKVAGIAWPQGVSHWENITQKEWSDGADALLSVKGKTAVVLGVQTVGFDPAQSSEYAQEAQRKGANAVMSQCKPGASQEEVIGYFQALAKATSLPLMVQTTGNITLDEMVALSEQVPQIVVVKDEAQGDVLARAPELLTRTHGRLLDFSGHGGNTMFSEMELGFTGTCPYVGMADVQQQVFNLYMAGKKAQAFDVFGRYLAFNSIPRANEYVLVARGVLPENSIFRGPPPSARPPPARQIRQSRPNKRRRFAAP
jgi:dihydrodipicolinate synthase/N-acetylneuraminate lyase